ncbi:MAG: class I SAM-dependent methyltransferase [Bacteroidaceae bacterium]|nr:class I SAM-dependent methyltransferase [Bacteroidaceae bacterium]
MRNPWEEISLYDYENHMSLDSVNQLQTMNAIMKAQFDDYPTETAMILGVAGGNGLEHIRTEKYRTVYGIDINEAYLEKIRERYPMLKDVLRLMCLDLTREADRLPAAELAIANLLVEYIGYQAFAKAIRQIGPKYVSCVIQVNGDKENWVSESPYLHAFDRLDEIHHQMEENALEGEMNKIGYVCISKSASSLPNGKKLLRIDFAKSTN